MFMLSNVNQESKSVSEKIGKMDLERLLVSALAEGSICTFEFATNSVTKFDSNQIPATATSNPSVTTLHSGPSLNSPPLLTSNHLASMFSSSLFITGIELGNILPTGVANTYTGELKISYDISRLVRPLNQSTLKVYLTTIGNGNIKTVTSCKSVSSTFGSCPNTTSFVRGFDPITGEIICQTPLPVYQ